MPGPGDDLGNSRELRRHRAFTKTVAAPRNNDPVGAARQGVRMTANDIHDTRKFSRYGRLAFNCAPPRAHLSVTGHCKGEVVADANRSRDQ